MLAASSGSVEFLLEPLGQVARVLLSDPVQLTLTVRALLGGAVAVRAWLARRVDSSTMRADEVTAILEAALHIQSAATNREQASPDAEIHIRGVRASGHRITYVRLREDGGADVLIVE